MLQTRSLHLSRDSKYFQEILGRWLAIAAVKDGARARARARARHLRRLAAPLFARLLSPSNHSLRTSYRTSDTRHHPPDVPSTSDVASLSLNAHLHALASCIARGGRSETRRVS